MLVSPLVRRALFAGTLDCRPVWQSVTKPALVVHGACDRIVLPIVGQTAAETLPNSSLSLIKLTAGSLICSPRSRG